MTIHRHVLKSLGYSDKESANIMRQVARIVPCEVRMTDITVSGARHGNESMGMMVFMSCVSQHDFIEACVIKAEQATSQAKEDFWHNLSAEIAEL